jgi:uncharacterized protein
MSSRHGPGPSASGQQAERADDDTERAVAAYLLRQPDFLVRHPEVLAKLYVPHGAGGAVSLIEHQVAVLREQLAHERGRLNHLMARAHEYEQLSTRLHELTVALITVPDLERACAALEAALREQFNAEAVAIKLFPVDPAQRAEDPLAQAFDDAAAIRSAALVPVCATDQAGVLAIGSRDPKRFTPDMGTELLDRLGAIVGAKLTDLAHHRHG